MSSFLPTFFPSFLLFLCFFCVFFYISFKTAKLQTRNLQTSLDLPNTYRVRASPHPIFFKNGSNGGGGIFTRNGGNGVGVGFIMGGWGIFSLYIVDRRVLTPFLWRPPILLTPLSFFKFCPSKIFGYLRFDTT